MQQRDYIQRLIEQLAAVVANILGFAKEGRVAEADRLIEDAWTSNLGLRRADAERLDDGTLKMMLGEKVALAAALFEVGAAVEAARGDEARAATLRRRAENLRPR